MDHIPDEPIFTRWTRLGVALSPYALPPRDLAALAPEVPADERPPQGLLADHVGARYPASLMEDDDVRDRETWPLLHRVRAFPVPALIGTTFTAAHPIATMTALLAHLARRLPGIAWGVTPQAMLYPFVAALHKYALAVDHLPAPPDLATGQPMGLEVALRITHLNGEAIETASGQAFKAQLYRLEAEMGDVTVYHGWLTDIQLQITQLTYTNLRGTGINTPWYM